MTVQKFHGKFAELQHEANLLLNELKKIQPRLNKLCHQSTNLAKKVDMDDNLYDKSYKMYDTHQTCCTKDDWNFEVFHRLYDFEYYQFDYSLKNIIETLKDMTTVKFYNKPVKIKKNNKKSS